MMCISYLKTKSKQHLVGKVSDALLMSTLFNQLWPAYEMKRVLATHRYIKFEQCLLLVFESGKRENWKFMLTSGCCVGVAAGVLYVRKISIFKFHAIPWEPNNRCSNGKYPRILFNLLKYLLLFFKHFYRSFKFHYN